MKDYIIGGTYSVLAVISMRIIEIAINVDIPDFMVGWISCVFFFYGWKLRKEGGE